MIEEFVKSWDQRKGLLEEHIRKQRQEDIDYEQLVKWLIEIVINPAVNPAVEYKLNAERIHTIDDGDYQGSLLFIVPPDTYQPLVTGYLFTYVEYGSCSGCDILESIRVYNSGLPNEHQVKEYMTLELHLLQKFRWMMQEESYHEDIVNNRN